MKRPCSVACALVAAFALLASSPARGEAFMAKVIVVLDGDTVVALRESQKIRIRLANIDAPEKAQAGGMASRQSLADMVLRRQVQVVTQAVDAYGRLVGTLTVQGVNANEAQVRRGMAWEYSNHHRDQRYIDLEREARQARRGLWEEPHPVPPWSWRRQHAADAANPAAQPAQASGRAACGKKRFCSQMASCAEAKFYLAQCGEKSLDGNRDGVPCENLCEPTRRGADH